MRFGDYLIGHCGESINNGNIRLPKLVADLVDAINGLEEHLAALSDKLEHLSTRVEGMSIKAPVEALEELESGALATTSGVVDEPPKHPLENYQITEKDVGSLCWFDYEDVSLLVGVKEKDNWPYQMMGGWSLEASPHLDPIRLHFIPHYATNPGVVPPGLLDGNPDAVAVLWDNGQITILYDRELTAFAAPTGGFYWCSGKGMADIIGYRPLSFVNPLLNGDE